MLKASTDNLLPFAKVLKSNGTEGELVLRLQETAPEDINQMELVFIFYDGLPVPFFIQECSLKGSKLFIRLNDITSYEDAEEVVGRNVYIERPEGYENKDDLSNLIGWSVLNSSGDKIGIIKDVEDIPGNPCIYIDTGENQVMIPLNEELILSVEASSKEISIDIPQGLI